MNFKQISSNQTLDRQYMRRALELARRGVGRVDPNPMVGAVVVKDGRIIAEGWHVACGQLHAERHALSRATEDVRGATMYVTLEPCCHQGKQPPCTDAIIEAGIARVVMGAPDPNPLVAGKGVSLLREAGIEVSEGVLVDECLAINEVFFHYIQTNRPYLVLKYAMTLDGKIATRRGASQWLTGEEARRRTHLDRNRYAAIMVGIGTVLADNPSLTCRLEDINAAQPVRIVVDSSLKTPLDSALVNSAREVPVIIATTNINQEEYLPYEEKGCEVLLISKSPDRGVDLSELFAVLGKKGVSSVVVEGGPTLHASLLATGLVSRVQTYIAPKLFGGQEAPSPIGGFGFAQSNQAPCFNIVNIEHLGADVLIEAVPSVSTARNEVN